MLQPVPDLRRRAALAVGVMVLAALPACASSPAATAAPGAPAPAARPAADAWAAKTAGLERRDGFVPLWIAPDGGTLHLELPGDSLRALLHVIQATGLGSNPIGIDRGASADDQVVRFERVGERVLVTFENWRYRTSLADTLHQRTIRESFPHSTVASLPVVARRDGRLLVDATDFVLRDWTDVASTLQRAQQGSYAVAKDRSKVNRQYTRAFPGNTEIDVDLTFATSGTPGGIVRSIVPDGRALTLRQHLTLLPLPDDGYRPRVADARVGYFGPSFKDFGQPVQGALDQRWIARHRLERTNPADPASPIRNPIVYYVDPGIPEPMRSATLEGARFWEQAFDRAGLRGGFQVRLLPDSADPMDARYNVVQWVNRNERGWSVGGSLGDPRTGQILKGMARMDSHRARTAYNLYAGLMGADAAAADTAFVLGRVRQVTAHEIGHTLGLAHNYIASTYERGSVMDYPAPRVRLTSAGEVDLRAAYDLGPGPYDVWAVRWGYGTYPAAAERDSLSALVAEGLRRGWLFLSDADARPEFAADPRTNLWDDAGSAEEFFRHQMGARRVAMQRFGERNIRPGEAVSLLQERFVPVYFLHRFAVQSLAKAVGGMEYANAMRGDGQTATRPVAPARQRQALSLLLEALAPAALLVPDTVVSLLGPRPYGTDGSVELFGSRARPAFDDLGAARTAAQLVVDNVLQPDRAGRLVLFAARDPRTLSLGETIDSLVAASWRAPQPRRPREAAVQRTVQRAVADGLLQLAAAERAMPEVRALADYRLAALRDEAARRAGAGDEMTRAHWLGIRRDLARWLDERELPPLTAPLTAPPGDPFGAWSAADGHVDW